MAQVVSVGLDRYRTAESGGPELPDFQPYPYRWNELTPQQKCIVLRRRVSMSQQEVADSLGCSRVWVNRMENGRADVEMLRQYWEI